jgi:hypothetical protein
VTPDRSPLHHPGDRWTDRPIVQKIKSGLLWAWRNRAVIGPGWLLMISVILTITAIRVNDLNTNADRTRREAARTAKIAAAQSLASCQRNKVFGPRLAQVYGMRVLPGRDGRFHAIMGPRQLAAYKAGIPKTCKK